MKKYLISGAMALALGCTFVSCSDNDEWMSYGEAKMQAFDEAFTKIYGQIDPRQDWGFGAANAASQARNVTRSTYPNANMWAETWVVPPQLTWEQKEIVRQYFQQVDHPDYDDPGWTNYFVQQVYKGGTKAKGKGDDNSLTTEQYQSANNGWVVGSDHMDHLEAVFADNTAENKHRDHIFNYNNGTCSTNGNVQNSEGVDYYDPKTDTQHSDEIQLMVNSTTHAFGYFNSDGSLGHTEYTGLVGWETIRTWANAHNLNGDCLNDGWNRSFMGFDFEQVVGDDIYAKENVVWENGKIKSYDISYAKYNQATESPQYIWDGQNVYPIQSGSTVSDREIIESFSLTNFWNSQESATYANGVLTYNAKSWGGLLANFGKNTDFSPYTSVVVEFAEPTTVGAQILIELGDNWKPTKYESAGARSIEFTFANQIDSWNLANSVQLIAIQAEADTQLKISRIYLKGTGGGTGVSEYMVYDNKQVPYLSSDQNTYCGDFYEYTDGKDLLTTQTYNGQSVTCLNWKKVVDDRLSKGWLPVAGSDMKKWVKVHGGADGYYSDWIVTLTQARTVDNKGIVTLVREEDGNEPGILEYWRKGKVTRGRIFVEDLARADRGDIDFNDVVFDAYIYDTEITKIKKKMDGTQIGEESDGKDQFTKIDVLACGGTLPLTVAGTEVHSLFGQSTTTMINTIGEKSILSNGYNPQEYKTIGRAPYFESLSAIKVAVKVNDTEVMELNNASDLGAVPHMICVPLGTPWPLERVAIGPDKQSPNTDDCAFPLFAQYVGNADVNPWSNYNKDNMYEWNVIPENTAWVVDVEEKVKSEETIFAGKVRTEYTVNVSQMVPTPEGTLVGNTSLYPHQTKDGSDGTRLNISGQDFQTAGIAIGKKVRIYGIGYDGVHKDGTGWMFYINGVGDRYYGKNMPEFKNKGYFDIDITANNLSQFGSNQTVQIEGWAFNILAITIVQ